MNQHCPIYSQNHLERLSGYDGRRQIKTKAGISPKLDGTFFVMMLPKLVRDEIDGYQKEDEGKDAAKERQQQDNGRIRRRIPCMMADVWNNPHPHIMKIHGFIRDPNVKDQKLVEFIRNDTNMTGITCVIYEDCPLDQTLKKYLEEEKKQERTLDRKTILQWAWQLISAVVHLHNMGVMHRRINLESIYVFENTEGGKFLKLGNILFGRKPAGPNLTNEVNVPRAYAAPETLRGFQDAQTAKYDLPSDIWSYGMIIYFLTHREDPYPKNEANKINFKEYLSNEENRPKLDDDLDELLKEIIRGCWKAEEKERLKPAEIEKKLTSVVDPNKV